MTERVGATAVRLACSPLSKKVSTVSGLLSVNQSVSSFCVCIATSEYGWDFAGGEQAQNCRNASHTAGYSLGSD